MPYYAHSGSPDDKRDWQLLRDHSFAVAETAAAMASIVGLEKAAFLAGLMHDLGKYRPEFQAYIEGRGTSDDHSTAGARLMMSGDLATGQDKVLTELISYCIAGHHTGLPDRRTSEASSLDRRLEKPAYAIDAIWKSELSPDATGLVPASFANLRKDDMQVAAFQLSMIVRAVFSCLVDAEAWIETGAKPAGAGPSGCRLLRSGVDRNADPVLAGAAFQTVIR